MQYRLLFTVTFYTTFYSKPCSINVIGHKQMNQGSSEVESSQCNASNLMNLIVPSTSINHRMRRIEEILDRIPYFYGSMLDDSNLQRRLLIELGLFVFVFFLISPLVFHFLFLCFFFSFAEISTKVNNIKSIKASFFVKKYQKLINSS